MKIEKISDNQIRCTLTKEDLMRRQLKISELAYGSEKAKILFREMMQQASYEFGFEAEDIPLMIEAIPLSTESVILVITKVEYPEELDTRFSRFSDSDENEEDSYISEDSYPAQETAESVLDMFREDRTLPAAKPETPFIPLKDAVAPKTLEMNVTKMFRFRNMQDLIRLCRVLQGSYHENSALYKNPKNHLLYLVISKGTHSPEDFNRVCNVLSEYAAPEKYSAALEAHFQEYYETLVPSYAVQVLGDL